MSGGPARQSPGRPAPGPGHPARRRRGRASYVPVEQHRTLGRPGRARGVDDRGEVVLAHRAHKFVVARKGGPEDSSP